jgi:hypothetical protein
MPIATLKDETGLHSETLHKKKTAGYKPGGKRFKVLLICRQSTSDQHLTVVD